MTEPRRTWRGKMVSPRTPAEAWWRFAVEMTVILAILGGIFVVALMTWTGGVTLEPKARVTYLWIIIGAGAILPLVVGYEFWILWKRLSAFARGEVFVDVDEVSPEDAPAPAVRKRRETPAQAKRRKAFWREMILVTVIWLFCVGVMGWVAASEWLDGKPLGNLGTMLAGLMVLYPIYVILSVYLKNEKDRGR